MLLSIDYGFTLFSVRVCWLRLDFCILRVLQGGEFLVYDVIKDIISHTWETTSGSSEQSYIYYVCGTLIILFTIWFLGFLKSMLFSLFRVRSGT